MYQGIKCFVRHFTQACLGRVQDHMRLPNAQFLELNLVIGSKRESQPEEDKGGEKYGIHHLKSTKLPS